MKPDVQVKDPVRVFDVNGRSYGQPDGGWPGQVVKVGRTLIHVEYASRGAPQVDAFSKETHRKKDKWGRRYFRTMAEVDASQRRSRAERILRRHGVLLSPSASLALEQIEALAEVARAWECLIPASRETHNV